MNPEVFLNGLEDFLSNKSDKPVEVLTTVHWNRELAQVIATIATQHPRFTKELWVMKYDGLLPEHCW